MVHVVISEAQSPATTLTAGLALLEESGEKIQFSEEAGKVLILIDTLLPEGAPSTVNPDTLGALIAFLKTKGASEIFILPGVLPGMKQENVLDFLGLKDYLENMGAFIITYSDFEPNHPTPSVKESNIQEEQQSISTNDNEGTDAINESSILAMRKEIPTLDQYNALIILAQVRTDPVFGLRTTIPLISSLQQEIPTSSTDDIDRVQGIIKQHPPTLVINDAFYFLEGNGPFIQHKTRMIKPQRMIITTDIMAADWVTLSHFGLETASHPYLSGNKPDFTLVTTKGISKPPDFQAAETDPTQIPIRGLKLFLGEMTEGVRQALVYFLSRLQTLFFKDATNLENWAILAGTNPPEPGDAKNILLFGDNAITSTRDHKFRTIVKKKDILEGDDLEKAIYRKQAKIQVKMDKAQLKSQTIIEDIIANKEDLLDRQVSELEQNQKLQLKLQKLKHKSAALRINLPSKYEKRKAQNTIPKVKLNTGLIEVPGNPPTICNSLQPLYYNWAEYKVPLLHFYVDMMKQVYDFPNYDLKFYKDKWKAMKQELKIALEQQYAPLEPEVKAALAKIKAEKKAALLKLKGENKEALEKIKAEFGEKIKKVEDLIAAEKVYEKAAKKAAKEQDFPDEDITESTEEEEMI